MKFSLLPGDQHDRATIERAGESALIYLTLNGGAKRGDRLTQIEQTVGDVALIFDVNLADRVRGIEVIAPWTALSPDAISYEKDAPQLSEVMTVSISPWNHVGLHFTGEAVGMVFGATANEVDARWLRISKNAYALVAEERLRSYVVLVDKK